MSLVFPELSGGSSSYQLEDGSKLVNESDGVVKITNDAGALGSLMIADAVASTSPITKAQLDAVIDGAPALLDTLNEIAAAINDDENYAATISSIQATAAQKVTDFLAAVGIAANATTMGTFTGSTLPLNTTLRAVLQAVGTAVDLRATLADPSFTGTVGLSHIRSQGAHLLFQTDTNEFKYKLNDVEAWQGTKTSAANTMRFVAFGNNTDGIHEFMGTLKNVGNVETDGNISVGGTVDGRNVANDGAKVDNLVARYKSLAFGDAGSATDFGDVIKAGANVFSVILNVSAAFDAGSTIKVGINGTDDYFGVFTAPQTSAISVYELPKAIRIASDVQPTFTVTGSPNVGAAELWVRPSA